MRRQTLKDYDAIRYRIMRYRIDEAVRRLCEAFRIADEYHVILNDDDVKLWSRLLMHPAIRDCPNAESGAGGRDPRAIEPTDRGPTAAERHELRTYRCKLGVFLDFPDGTSFGSRQIELPFIPTPGMDLFGISRFPDGDEVKRVGYQVRNGTFYLDLGKYDEKSSLCNDFKSINDWKGLFGDEWTWEDDPIDDDESER